MKPTRRITALECMAETLELDVTYAARRPWAPRRALFLSWANAVLDGARQPSVLSVRVVGAARSRSLNARYRHKDKPTNVLSFGGMGLAPDGLNYLGELVICAPVVAQEARSQAKSREAHWAHMVVHGVLHLLGFDHEKLTEARRMAAREVQILDRLGFSDPYVCSSILPTCLTQEVPAAGSSELLSRCRASRGIWPS